MNEDALDASMALGRLTERLADPRTRVSWLADALRREICAGMGLDGRLVDVESLETARLRRTGDVPTELSDALAMLRIGNRLLGAAPDAGSSTRDEADALDERLTLEHRKALEKAALASPFDDEGFLPEVADDPSDDDEHPDERPPSPSPPVSFEEAVAACRADVRAGMSAVASARPELSPLPSAPPPPLSLRWFEDAWRALEGKEPEAETKATLEACATLTDEALSSRPRLLGVAEAFRVLHSSDLWPEPPSPALPDMGETDREAARAWRKGDYGTYLALVERREDETEAIRREVAETHQAVSVGPRFVRLLLPWLFMKGCGLPFPGPWLSSALSAHCRESYRGIRSLSPDAWGRSFCKAVVAASIAERIRLDALDLKITSWERRLRGPDGSLAANRRTVETLRLLVERPVVDTTTWASLSGTTRRMAQSRLHQLETRGIVRELTGRKTDRVWGALDLLGAF
jgi:hypothetical protein